MNEIQLKPYDICLKRKLPKPPTERKPGLQDSLLGSLDDLREGFGCLGLELLLGHLSTQKAQFPLIKEYTL